MKLLYQLTIPMLVFLVVLFGFISAAPVQANGGTLTVSKTTGYVGDEVYITGANFTEFADDWVYVLYETNDDYQVMTQAFVDPSGNFSSEIFKVPRSSWGKHYIGVSLNTLNVTPKYRVPFFVRSSISVSPDEGCSGTSVTVAGDGFREDEAVELRYYLDEDVFVSLANMVADQHGACQVTFAIPASTGGKHDIGACSDITGDIIKEQVNVKPLIKIDKASGCWGDKVTISGNGFRKNEAVAIYWDNEKLADVSAGQHGAWQAVINVPSCAQGGHEVDARGHYSSVDTLPFTVGPSISLNSASGHVGTTVAVSGSGFTAGSTVTITYDGAKKATAQTSAAGSFSDITLVATHAQTTHTANHPIVATDAAGNSATAQFTMESNVPPRPTLVSPYDGERLGVIGGQTPTFSWTAVDDPSGVSGYTLRVAHDPDFTDQVVEVTGLTDTTYTLFSELPTGRFYWQVKAVDGACNEGSWSQPYSFNSGMIPLWTLVLIIILLAGSIGVAVYFLVIKRRL